MSEAAEDRSENLEEVEQLVDVLLAVLGFLLLDDLRSRSHRGDCADGDCATAEAFLQRRWLLADDLLAENLSLLPWSDEEVSGETDNDRG